METAHAAPVALTREPRPLSAPEPSGNVTRPAKARPVWVNVPTDEGGEAYKRGFALAWTHDRVRVQVLWPKEYFEAATEFWVDASRVQRRAIEPQWLGRD
ncbi:hypothetical protein SCMU_27840 [Sinomonas cyclohexanicum]|uniref:Uncharacterized protein n=1 Tax=Sinomonas cyclohexanicum TaxID=322009 RepID=A0ABN6FJ84_SINCY|nr:hypothetical protein [Corynebacterium cyclohexanicum]BCT76942.1 hypothetical protein SCMU_27840 [Corynebacterium cyclohexanicum]